MHCSKRNKLQIRNLKLSPYMYSVVFHKKKLNLKKNSNKDKCTVQTAEISAEPIKTGKFCVLIYIAIDMIFKY